MFEDDAPIRRRSEAERTAYLQGWRAAIEEAEEHGLVRARHTLADLMTFENELAEVSNG